MSKYSHSILAGLPIVYRVPRTAERAFSAATATERCEKWFSRKSNKQELSQRLEILIKQYFLHRWKNPKPFGSQIKLGAQHLVGSSFFGGGTFSDFLTVEIDWTAKNNKYGLEASSHSTRSFGLCANTTWSGGKSHCRFDNTVRSLTSINTNIRKCNGKNRMIKAMRRASTSSQEIIARGTSTTKNVRKIFEEFYSSVKIKQTHKFRFIGWQIVGVSPRHKQELKLIILRIISKFTEKEKSSTIMVQKSCFALIEWGLNFRYDCTLTRKLNLLTIDFYYNMAREILLNISNKYRQKNVNNKYQRQMLTISNNKCWKRSTTMF